MIKTNLFFKTLANYNLKIRISNMSPNSKDANLKLIKKSPILNNENLELIEKCQTKLHYLLICQRVRKKLQRDLKGQITT